MKRRLIAGILGFWTLMAFGQAYFPSHLPTVTSVPPGGLGNHQLFLGVFRNYLPSPKAPINCVLDQNGEMLFYFVRSLYTYDFKVLPDGRLSFYSTNYFYLIDSTLQPVDSLRPVGYSPDVHELIQLPNGHFMLFGNAFRDSVDMTSFQTTNGQVGSPNATVKETVIQELDPAGGLVKEWRALDHFSLVDADFSNFTSPHSFDFSHGNSLEWDPSGKVMVSWRNLSEITLIDWATGNIIWRFGGNANQFAFLNDTLRFSAQHDARFVGPNRISLFDNGTYRQPKYSRALIYQLDTVNYTATLLNEISRPYRSIGMGSYRYLSDGTHLVNWGSRTDTNVCFVSWLDAVGNSLREFQFTAEYWTYRAQEGIIPWQISHPALSCRDSMGFTILSVDGGHTQVEWNTGEKSQSIVVQDSGIYFAYVNRGIGMIRTEKFHLSDPTKPCNSVGLDDEVLASPAKLIQLIDLFGRTVQSRKRGQVYIELYSDGSRRKVMEW